MSSDSPLEPAACRRAGIALGSNVEPRLDYLKKAARLLADISTEPSSLQTSAIYETAPVDCAPGSSHFFNAAIEFSTDLAPLTLWEHLHAIEIALGRPDSHGFNTPRTIDLDLLYLDDLVFQHEHLTLPHPRLALRRFVLQPLADICPDRHLPGFSQSISQMLSHTKNEENIKKTNFSFSFQ